MPAYIDPYVSLMKSLLSSTALSKQAVFIAFEQAIVTTDEARFVWNAFYPQVREAQLQRYYDQAVRLIAQESTPTPKPWTPPPAQPTAASTSATAATPSRKPTASATPPANTGKKRGNLGMDRISLDMIGDGPGRVPAYYGMTDHRGVVFGKLTRIALLAYHGVSPVINRFAWLLAENMPPSSRSVDTVEAHIPTELANRLWDEAQAEGGNAPRPPTPDISAPTYQE